MGCADPPHVSQRAGRERTGCSGISKPRSTEPSRQGLMSPGATPAAEVGMECTSRPPQMPRQASKNGGRSGHGPRFHCGAAAPEAVMQLKAGQRHAPSRSCTPEPRFRAHARPPHMCGPRTAPDPRSESEQTSPQVFVRATLLSTPDKTPTPFVSRPAGPVGRPATGQTPPARRHFVRADRAVHLRKESNDGTHEKKPPELRRRRVGPEPREGVPRRQDRPVPDGVARERPQGHPVAGTALRE